MFKTVELGEVLNYEQPTRYIVESDIYNDEYETPVLTAGKSFILGYTNEKENIYQNYPVIIFDDFTTATKYVDFPFKVKSSAMKILSCDENIADIKFLFYLIQTIKINSEQHQRYWISKFSKIKIPLPSLATQKAIAEKLDKADALRKKDQELLKQYDELAQSIFIDMFGDPVQNEKGFKIDKVQNIAAKEKHSIKAGPFGSSLKKEYYVEKGYKVYGQEQVIKDDLSFGDYYIDEKKFKELESCKVKTNDILISLVGTYGKISIIPEFFEEGIINPRLMKISPDINIVRPDFIKFQLQGDYVRRQLERVSRGGTMDIINVGIMKEVLIQIPPLKLQNQFAEKIKNIEAQKELVKKQAEASENLFRALLQESFNFS